MCIVCGIDFSEASWQAAEVAAGIAARLALPLYLVHAVAGWPDGVSADERASLLTATQRALEDGASKLCETGAEVRMAVELDPPETSLLRFAAERGAEILVFGATGMGRVNDQHGGMGVSRAVLGSVAQAVLAHTERPALLVRARRA